MVTEGGGVGVGAERKRDGIRNCVNSQTSRGSMLLLIVASLLAMQQISFQHDSFNLSLHCTRKCCYLHYKRQHPGRELLDLNPELLKHNRSLEADWN